MAKKYRVTLTSEERAELEALIKKRASQAAPVKRAYVLLAADEGANGPGWADEQIATTYQVSVRTIERLRERFVEEGLQIALDGKAREPKASSSFDGEVEAHLIALRCGPPPEGYARWSLRLLAEQMVVLEYVEQISHESVRQVLKKTN